VVVGNMGLVVHSSEIHKNQVGILFG